MPRSLLIFGLLVCVPGLAWAQEPKLVNCRTLEAAGNFVGPDEVIVDDLVCQKLKPGAEPAKAQPPKPIIGTVVSEGPADSVVDAAKAAEKRVASRREVLAQKNAAEGAAAAQADTIAPETPTPAETPAETTETAAAPPEKMATPVTAVPATPASASAPEPAPERTAQSSAPATVAPPAAADKQQPAASAEPVAKVTAEAAPVPAAKDEVPQLAPQVVLPDPEPAGKSESPAPAETVIPSATTPAPAPATERKTDSPAEVAAAPATAEPPAAPAAAEPAAATTESAAPAPRPEASLPPADPTHPATSGGFYDANAPKTIATDAPQTNTGFASAEQVNAGLMPGATSIPSASQPAVAEVTASDPEPQHTSIAASRVPFDDPDRDRNVKIGDFAKPKEVSPDPNAEHRTSVDPSDADGFQDRQRPECTKNITLGGLKGERLVLGVPGWAARWIEKNEKRMPQVCFSETPMKGARNYLIVFSTPAGATNTKDITDAVVNPEKGSRTAGVGTFTTNYGSTWHYSYDRNVGTTVLTREDADEPYGQPGQVLYATAYTDEGVPVSQRWPGQPKKQIKPGEKNRKKLKTENEAIEHVSGDLLEEMVEEIDKL